jgi:heptosyltransferase-2
MNIGIVLPNWIGDCVMATPALRAIRRSYPSPHHIVGVMKPYVADVLAGTQWLDETLLYDRTSRDPQLHFAGVAQQLRTRRLDVLVLLTNSLSSAWLAWRSGAKQRIGFARNGRSLLLTQRLQAPRANRKWLPISAVDYYLELAYALECPTELRRLELRTTPADERAADRIWRKFGFNRDEKVVVLSTGGAFGEAKSWPDEYFAQLARRIASELETSVLVICGPAERASAAAIEKTAAHSLVKSLAGEELSLGLSKACVRRSGLMIATDSGPRHFAAAFAVPIISLFGPTDPRWSINYHAGETRLFHPVDCGPCAQRKCPLQHHDCMRKLDVERVFAAAAKKLEVDRTWKRAA